MSMLRSTVFFSRTLRRPTAFFSQKISFFFVEKDKSLKQVTGKVGQTVLDVAHENDVDIEGACDSQLACSTCHVILEDKLYDSLPVPETREDDLLDMAFGLTSTSRLCCQLKLDASFEGAKIELPMATRNFYVDGFKPKPH